MEKQILISLSVAEFKELVKESLMEIFIEQERDKKHQDDKMLTLVENLQISFMYHYLQFKSIKMKVGLSTIELGVESYIRKVRYWILLKLLGNFREVLSSKKPLIISAIH